MRFNYFIYYGIGFLIVSIIGYAINYIVGFLAAFVLYAVFLVIISIFYGISDKNPVEKSPYEKRKKSEN
ncbi:MAG: hypothetical protein RBT46_01575 [Weeksellaceae bacterium]|jgi:uncharacterized membrane protein required for colicin V production|nr:hypothetical protein [Weeksellaceae bacterium]MDX9704384.1 hypothetical protein [Weeksellaceae bacterium]